MRGEILAGIPANMRGEPPNIWKGDRNKFSLITRERKKFNTKPTKRGKLDVLLYSVVCVRRSGVMSPSPPFFYPRNSRAISLIAPPSSPSPTIAARNPCWGKKEGRGEKKVIVLLPSLDEKKGEQQQHIGIYVPTGKKSWCGGGHRLQLGGCGGW